MSYEANTNLNIQPDWRPNWFRAVAALGVAWFTFGFSQFVKNMTMMMDVAGAVASGAITAAHGAAIAATPLFVWGAYFVACVLGLAGAVQLFRGHASASRLLILSLIFDVVYFGWIRFLSGTASARPAEAGIIAVIVLTITAVLALLSLRKA